MGFCYPKVEREALSAIDLHIAPGETVALVGSSGSGKTTLVNLLPRFYDPSAGQILLDDVPLAELRLANLRSHIAMVSQDVTLFNDSVAANIAYGCFEQVSREQIIEARAAKCAGLYRGHAAGL